MHRILLSLVIALNAYAAYADYISLSFKTVDGQETQLASKGLEITFEGEKLIAKSSEETLAIPISNLKSMAFTGYISGITGLYDAEAGENTEVSIFRTDGTKAGNFQSISDAISFLPHGLYILKNTKGETIKLVVK